MVLIAVEKRERRVEAAVDRELALEIRAGVPLSRDASCIIRLLHHVPNRRHADVHRARFIRRSVRNVNMERVATRDERGACGGAELVNVKAVEDDAVRGKRVERWSFHSIGVGERTRGARVKTRVVVAVIVGKDVNEVRLLRGGEA